MAEWLDISVTLLVRQEPGVAELIAALGEAGSPFEDYRIDTRPLEGGGMEVRFAVSDEVSEEAAAAVRDALAAFDPVLMAGSRGEKNGVSFFVGTPEQVAATKSAHALTQIRERLPELLPSDMAALVVEVVVLSRRAAAPGAPVAGGMRCIVGRLALSPHPTLPSMRVGTILGQTVVVGDHYEDGVPGIYIPAGALVPDGLAEEMWVRGRLAGSKRNRVKSREVGGITSSGLFYGSRFWTPASDGTVTWHEGASWDPAWLEGDDVTAAIGVTFREDS